MLDHHEGSAHGLIHPGGETAAQPTEPPSTTPAALRILAMAQAMAAVRVLPARPMMNHSGAPDCRSQAERGGSAPAGAPEPIPAPARGSDPAPGTGTVSARDLR